MLDLNFSDESFDLSMAITTAGCSKKASSARLRNGLKSLRVNPIGPYDQVFIIFACLSLDKFSKGQRLVIMVIERKPSMPSLKRTRKDEGKALSSEQTNSVA